jgi:hypothetical protein
MTGEDSMKDTLTEEKKITEKPEILLDKYISLDQCPSCKSTETFHSLRMREYREGVSNAFGIGIKESSTNPGGECILYKQDLCLECGHTWIMFIQHILIPKNYKSRVSGVSEEMQEKMTTR